MTRENHCDPETKHSIDFHWRSCHLFKEYANSVSSVAQFGEHRCELLTVNRRLLTVKELHFPTFADPVSNLR